MNRRIVRFGDALLGASSIVGQGAAGLILMHSHTRADRGFMLDTTLTISYDTPWRQVDAMLTEAARRRAAHPLHASIQDVFNEYGVQILSPHYPADPATEKRVPPDNWYAPPAHRPDPA